MEQSKIEQIKKTLAETRLRRTTQRCITYEFKINVKKLNKSEYEKLKFMFVQCKWLYNYLLNSNKIEEFDLKSRDITSLDKDGNLVERKLDLPAKVIESVYKEIKTNLKTISSIKKKGRKIGRLKFKSEYNSIDLNQYGVTHSLRGKGFKINKFKRIIKVYGLEQLKDKNYEYANAKLIQKPTGYYIFLTCFENLTLNSVSKQVKEVGLDFGIKTNITTSDGEKFNIFIAESERLKGLQKKLFRQVKGSNNRNKTIQKIRVEYEKLSNKKKDGANKLVSYLCTKYSTVYMQDEMIGKWQKELFGRQVQHSCLGTIKNKLKRQNNVQVIDKSLPTTKLCYNCGTVHRGITLSDRTFTCPTCHFSEDRDLKASKTILFIGQCKNTYTPTEHRSTNVEKMLDFLNAYADKKLSSMKHESQ